MELYILDSSFRRVTVIDRFESLIWTERFNELGDFKLIVYPTNQMRSLLVENTVLGMNESSRLMVIVTTELRTDSTGKKTLTVTGRSIELLLTKRIAANSLASPLWEFSDTPRNIAMQVFSQICIFGRLSDQDIISFASVGGSIYPPDTIPAPDTVINLKLEAQTVYEAIKNLCDVYKMGFRFVVDPMGYTAYFDVYTGNDRSTLQTVNSPVVFSDKLDNLTDTTELTSIEDAAQCAYVFSPLGSKVVYPDGGDENATDFARRIIMVNASDLTTSTNVDGDLDVRGKAALAEAQAFKAFDGEINEYSQYKYGVDYQLGDLIEIRNDDGAFNVMRVTEQIFSSDASGDRSYPTLSIDLAVTAGSWLSWPINDEWVDFTTEVWSDLP